jgi:hypothetical protein
MSFSKLLTKFVTFTLKRRKFAKIGENSSKIGEDSTKIGDNLVEIF